MNGSELITRTEVYVKEVMGRQAPAMAVAHDFKHVDRVRNWALTYARIGEYPDLVVVEVTALLHDIGLGYVTGKEAETSHVVLPPHGPLGAEAATEFLKVNSDFDPQTIDLITDAIRHHSDPPMVAAEYIKEHEDKGALLKILRDADMTDAMGAVGLIRALTSKSFLPEYDPGDVKGPTWGLSTAEFLEKFGGVERKLAAPKTIIDQINQQIRSYDGLHTQAARDIAAPLVEFMRTFITRLEQEINAPVRIFRRNIRYQGAVVRDEHVLLVKYRQQHNGRTFWVLPGGGLEPDETEEECVRREIQEETRMNVEVVSLVSDKTRLPGDNSIYLRKKTFLCRPIDGKAAPGIEPESYDYSIIAIGWFDLRNPDSWDSDALDDTKTVRTLEDLRADLGYL